MNASGRVSAGVGFGPLPSAGAVLEAAAGLGGLHWAAHLTAEGWTPSTAQTAAGSTARIWLAAFGVEGCGVLTPAARWTIPLCAGAVIGPMQARGLEVRDARTRRTAWIAARVQPSAVGWLLPWLGVGLQLSGHLALYRPIYSIEPTGVVHEARLAGVRAGVALVLRNRRTW